MSLTIGKFSFDSISSQIDSFIGCVLNLLSKATRRRRASRLSSRVSTAKLKQMRGFALLSTSTVRDTLRRRGLSTTSLSPLPTSRLDSRLQQFLRPSQSLLLLRLRLRPISILPLKLVLPLLLLIHHDLRLPCPSPPPPPPIHSLSPVTRPSTTSP